MLFPPFSELANLEGRFQDAFTYLSPLTYFMQLERLLDGHQQTVTTFLFITKLVSQNHLSLSSPPATTLTLCQLN